MRLILRHGTPLGPGQIITEDDNFSEPFLPNVGDFIIAPDGQPVQVTGRAFSFAAGAPGVQGIELFVP